MVLHTQLCPLDIHLLFSEVWEFLEQPVVVCSTPSHNTAHPPSSLYMSILLIAFGQVVLLKWMLMLGLSPGILWCYDTSFQLVWSFWLRGWLFQISCLGVKKKTTLRWNQCSFLICDKKTKPTYRLTRCGVIFQRPVSLIHHQQFPASSQRRPDHLVSVPQ